MYCEEPACWQASPCILHGVQAEVSSTVVTPTLFLQFLSVMTKRLKSDKWCAQLPAPPAGCKNREQAAELVEAKLLDVYKSLWVSLGAEATAGLGVQMKPALLLEQLGDDQGQAAAVVSALNEYTDLEADTVRRVSLGPKRYAKAMERDREMERSMDAARKDLTNKLQAMPVEEQHNYIANIQKQARAIGAKVQALSPKAMQDYMASMPAAERMVMMQMQILRQTLGGGAEGHSHGGVPCDGHH